jgi:hypothetical protein
VVDFYLGSWHIRWCDYPYHRAPGRTVGITTLGLAAASAPAGHAAGAGLAGCHDMSHANSVVACACLDPYGYHGISVSNG